MTTRVLIVGLVVLCLIGLVAAGQLLGRAAGAFPVEVHLRPLTAARRRGRAGEPAELMVVQHLVRDTFAGDHAAAARLAGRLGALGVVVADPHPASVQAALQQLLAKPLAAR
ncbi:MAG: hypothetical protein ACKV2O_18040 [Acidimicrobiales bacterium]